MSMRKPEIPTPMRSVLESARVTGRFTILDAGSIPCPAAVSCLCAYGRGWKHGKQK